MKKIAIIGAGFLAGIVVEAYNKGMLQGYEIVAILGRDKEHANVLVEKCNVKNAQSDRDSCNKVITKSCDTIEELLLTKPDYVVEAASVASVKDNAVKVLTNGASFIVLSIGAFADKQYFDEVTKVADAAGQKIYLTSGAVGGFDVLRTLSMMADGDMKAEISTHKGPKSLMNTPLFKDELLEDGPETQVFTGNAKEAIALLPTKVNVAVATALASAGPEQTQVRITSVPGMVGDDHCITAEAAGCKTVIDTYSPTSAIAGWSVVALLQNLNSSIVVF